MAIVFLGVARPKHRHPGKPSPKPRPLAAIVDLNLTIDHKWVVAQEIGSKWGADAPHPIFPFLTCWSTNPDLKGGQVTAYRTTIGGICKLSKYCIQGGHLIKMYPKALNSAFLPLQFPGNLPPPAEMIPETREIECEPIYAADSLTLSQMKVFLMYLCIIFCCTFPYSLFKGYHLRNKSYFYLEFYWILLQFKPLFHTSSVKAFCGLAQGHSKAWTLIDLPGYKTTITSNPPKDLKFYADSENNNPSSQFVIFSLAPVLVFICTTSPNLWHCLSSSAHKVGDGPSRLLHLLDDLLGQTSNFLSSEEILVKSLIVVLPRCELRCSPTKEPLVAPSPQLAEEIPDLCKSPEDGLTRTPWMLTGLGLMGLEAYFPQVSSLGSLFREASPVIL
ncbi:hypothetical protein DSO57_1031928 [Entomophthora muscae]|uniref:Uncharacterized protein n=1 Tax=Entomophthora muscae TaxID=34485 RepID=A0ACC2SDI9_9FUNG|nr:hypothetical protein DSO57_1031928 [Entomophthora muscae]